VLRRNGRKSFQRTLRQPFDGVQRKFLSRRILKIRRGLGIPGESAHYDPSGAKRRRVQGVKVLFGLIV
jgi:hypothetical protein